MKTLLKWVTSVLIMLAIVPAAQAITFGEPDGENHPNVGAMIVLGKEGEKQLYCSGTLIAPRVFLTAAHCTIAAAIRGVNANEVYVSFDPNIEANDAALHRGTYYLNPNYGHDQHDLHDIAVIILDKPIDDITPAELPPIGLLTDLQKEQKGQKGAQFTAVGYGTLRDDKTGGPHALGGYGERYAVQQTFQALKPYWLQLSMNPATDNGGTCYGDSGGPHFWGDNLLVSLTVTGDAVCRATDITYRLDTESAQLYLSNLLKSLGLDK